MHDVSTSTRHVTPAVSNVDLIAEAKKNLGVTTVAEVAAACGLSKSTLERLVANPSSTILGNAVRFSRATGIPITCITDRLPAQQLAEAA
ncbi:helix-turn-helix transcriptional regulator [Micromonospora tulbaghiae]|uniref:helix-turn-helix transcriptional regulator n=1 Tax=Micromonospora tulbaghiae TaxID=479978 RepID=UPI0033A706D0